MIVRHTKPFVTYVGTHFFYPGNNEFTETVAAELQVMPEFQSKVNAGQLQIIGGDATPAVVSPVATKSPALKIAARISVSNLAVAAATKVIQGTFNKSELLRVQSIDQRKGIQDAINAQLQLIDSMDDTKTEENQEN